MEDDGTAALGRPRDGEGLAVGKPRDEEGKLGSETADGKLLMCSLFTRSREKLWKNFFFLNVTLLLNPYMIATLKIF